MVACARTHLQVRQDVYVSIGTAGSAWQDQHDSICTAVSARQDLYTGWREHAPSSQCDDVVVFSITSQLHTLM